MVWVRCLVATAFVSVGRSVRFEDEVEAAKAAPLITSTASVKGGPDKWTPWAKCPTGSAAVGIARLNLLETEKVKKPKMNVDHFECGDDGCHAWCLGVQCEVAARCAKDVVVTNASMVQGGKDKLSPYSKCTGKSVLVGIGMVDLQGGALQGNVNDIFCKDNGCSAFCTSQECKVIARCAENIEAKPGPLITGKANEWSEYSTCEAGYEVAGIFRLNLLDKGGKKGLANENVNDVWCDDKGCKAWCRGSGCEVRSSCIRKAPVGSAQ